MHCLSCRNGGGDRNTWLWGTSGRRTGHVCQRLWLGGIQPGNQRFTDQFGIKVQQCRVHRETVSKESERWPHDYLDDGEHRAVSKEEQSNESHIVTSSTLPSPTTTFSLSMLYWISLSNYRLYVLTVWKVTNTNYKIFFYKISVKHALHTSADVVSIE